MSTKFIIGLLYEYYYRFISCIVHLKYQLAKITLQLKFA